MTERSTAPARVLAMTALIVGFIVLVVAIGASLGGDSSDSNGKRPAGQVTRKGGDGKREAVGAYVVQNGDTLTSIAHKTGVSVAQIQALNPGVDPQILISGEKLKLR
jgi:LysM repeat protein